MGKDLEPDKINKLLPRILESFFWPSGLNTDEVYERHHDDDDGTGIGKLMVQIDSHGNDAFITIDGH